MWTKIQGWESPSEQGLLAVLANCIPSPTGTGVIVEIGSEHGMSTSIFTLYSDYHELHCVEINPDAKFLENLENNGIRPYRTTWHNESSHTLEWDSELKIDLLFIDGDHSYGGAYKDIDIWSQRMKPRGVIVVHDCACSTNKNPHESHYEVMSAIQNWLAETGSKDGWRIAFCVDSSVVLMRGNNG